MSKAKYRILQERIIKTNLFTGEKTEELGYFHLQKRNSWFMTILHNSRYEDMWELDSCGIHDTLEDAISDLEKYLEKNKFKTKIKYDVVWEMK